MFQTFSRSICFQIYDGVQRRQSVCGVQYGVCCIASEGQWVISSSIFHLIVVRSNTCDGPRVGGYIICSPCTTHQWCQAQYQAMPLHSPTFSLMYQARTLRWGFLCLPCILSDVTVAWVLVNSTISMNTRCVKLIKAFKSFIYIQYHLYIVSFYLKLYEGLII